MSKRHVWVRRRGERPTVRSEPHATPTLPSSRSYLISTRRPNPLGTFIPSLMSKPSHKSRRDIRDRRSSRTTIPSTSTPRQPELSENQLERYECVGEMSGLGGRTYLVKERHTGKRYALKRPRTLSKLLEIATLRLLDHRNIIFHKYG